MKEAEHVECVKYKIQNLDFYLLIGKTGVPDPHFQWPSLKGPKIKWAQAIKFSHLDHTPLSHAQQLSKEFHLSLSPFVFLNYFSLDCRYQIAKFPFLCPEKLVCM